MPELYKYLPELQDRELIFVKNLTKEYSEKQIMDFATVYRARRRDPQLILLTTLLGFIIVAGVQRFLLGQIGMGILYLFTGGLCLIGTIVDLVNYKDLTFEFNQKVAHEVDMMIK